MSESPAPVAGIARLKCWRTDGRSPSRRLIDAKLRGPKSKISNFCRTDVKEEKRGNKGKDLPILSVRVLTRQARAVAKNAKQESKPEGNRKQRWVAS
jgi:hypothetical protein